MRILDLGGRPQFWQASSEHPSSVTVLNLYKTEAPEDWMEIVAGDACDPPETVRSESYDLIFSNSLLEHLGGFERRRRCAEFINSKADRHWIQTPYRYFPIEPHWLFPGFQFLPLVARSAITRHWPLGYMKTPEAVAATVEAASVELLTLTEMRLLFPESMMHLERFGGLVKSMTAIR